MAVLGLLKMFFCECYPDLYLIGKIMLAPVSVVAVFLLIPIATFEFVLIDVWAFILCLLSKNLEVKDMFNFFLD